MASGTSDRFGMAIRQADPRNAEFAYRAGLNALKQGTETEALPLLETATKARPGDARLWQVKGLLHRALEDLAPAVGAFRHAAKLAPHDPLIAHGLARVHYEAGLPAVDLYRAAQRLAPLDGELLLGLAAALYSEAGPAPAIDELDAMLLRNPGWLAGHDTLAKLRWQSGEREGFTASLERALASNPRDLNLWRTLLIILTQGDLYDLALDAVSRGRAAAGHDLLFDANEAVCRTEIGNAADADRLFADLAHLDDATVRVRHVRHLLRTGRPAEAAELGLSMIQGPAAHMFWPYLSVAWRMIGDPRWQWLEGDPRLIGVYDLPGMGELLPALAERLRGLHFARSQPLEQSVRGGTQTEGALFARIEPEIRSLREAIVRAVETHVAQLPPRDPHHPLLAAPRDRPVRFAGSWSVRLKAQGHHSNHVHPAGWLSSALYVALPGEDERGPPPSGWLSLGEPQVQLGLDLPAIRLVEPKPGRLVLFPSTMWHGTRPFEAGERLTVAFDVALPR